MATATKKATREFYKQFPETAYDISHDVPILDEHERPDGSYCGKDRLQAIIDENNFRINDTGDYVPLILGHTPDEDEKAKGAEVPPIIGYAGPFKLSMIGSVKPRWCIVAEHWAIEKNHAAEAKKNPRRSVEMWTEEGIPKYIDPIALLGATTPRRSLGLKMAARGGLKCEYYEMATAGANTGVPDMAETDDEPEKMEASTDDALVAKILASLESTDVFQFVRQQMAVQSSGNDPADQIDEQGEQFDEESNQPTDDDGTAPVGDDDAGEEESDDMGDAPKKTAKKPEQFKANGEVEKYRKELADTKAELTTVNEKYAKQEARLASLEKDRLQLQRETKIRDMIEAGVQIDLAEAKAEVAPMGDAEFDRYCATVQKYRQGAPIGHTLPQPVKETYAKDSAEKRKDDIAKAQEMFQESQGAGKKITFEQCLKKVKATAAA